MNEPPIARLPGEPSSATLRAFVHAGHFFSLATLVLWVLMYLWKGDPYDQTWQIILLTAFFGRAAALGAGLSMDFSPFFLYYLAAVTDLILVLYIFPAFVVGYQHLTGVRYIGNYLENLHKVALSYKDRVAPYGVVGLLVFVIFPFWSTGPLVASIIGYLIGLPAVITLVCVTAANILAIGAWVGFYDWLHDWNKGLAMVLLVGLFALAIGGFLFAWVRRIKKRALKAPTPGDGPPPRQT